jgi:plasmid stability protein
MAQLIVRNIEDAVVHKLRIQAAAHGISMEEEHRRLLRSTLLGERENRKSFSQMLLSIPKATACEPEDLFARQRDLPREIEE